MTPLELYVTAPKGVADMLAAELSALGASDVVTGPAGAAARGTLETAYRICLWSRLASRVLLTLGRVPAERAEALYLGVRDIDWTEHLPHDGTIAVGFSGTSDAIANSHFGALKTKDAIVDRVRAKRGTRPSVDVEAPDLRVQVRLHRGEAVVSIDLSGDSLHRRGYRSEQHEAPLKENLAAAVLVRAGWPEVARAGGAFWDPLCGSGTLPIEAALIAGDVAPGLWRERWGFSRWRGHDAVVWKRLRAEAKERREAGVKGIPSIGGSDIDAHAIAQARANAARAGLADRLSFRQLDVTEAMPPAGATSGLVVTNPPYGERLGDPAELEPLYRALGERLLATFKGFRAAVLTPEPRLAAALGLKVYGKNVFYNGALRCTLYRAELTRLEKKPHVLGSGAESLRNRLAKNHKHWSRWAARQDISCYRLYDADLPEYAFAIDRYERFVHVQEYAPPRSVDPAAARARRKDLLALLPEVLGVERTDIFVKTRKKQKGGTQYERQGERGRIERVQEGSHTFLVNLTDYLDTGLFLDHRLTRALVGELARGRRFLNLFAYTGSATVYAARGGAASSVSVDLSNVYCDWAEQNLRENRIDLSRHEIVRADVLRWLEEERGRYGLIFLDPPTFSTSTSMERTFDVQRDHVALLRRTALLLEPDGTLIFSNNFRRFRMDEGGLPGLRVEEITAETIPEDFARNPRIHNCWRITHRSP